MADPKKVTNSDESSETLTVVRTSQGGMFSHAVVEQDDALSENPLLVQVKQPALASASEAMMERAAAKLLVLFAVLGNIAAASAEQLAMDGPLKPSPTPAPVAPTPGTNSHQFLYGFIIGAMAMAIAWILGIIAYRLARDQCVKYWGGASTDEIRRLPTARRSGLGINPEV
jgi:hypothetical protein